MPDTEWELDRSRCWERFHRWLVAERHRLREERVERFDKVLALWLDLERAMYTRETHHHGGQPCLPWDCVDKDVNAAWVRLTHPQNALALETLFYQLADETQIDLARKALKISRDREQNS